HREIHERGRSTEDRRPAHLRGTGAVQEAAVERGNRPTRVYVGIDPARNDQLARRIDDASDVIAERAGRRDGRDGLTLNRHVSHDDAVGRDDFSTPDHDVEHDYASPKSSARSFAGSPT